MSTDKYFATGHRGLEFYPRVSGFGHVVPDNLTHVELRRRVEFFEYGGKAAGLFTLFVAPKLVVLVLAGVWALYRWQIGRQCRELPLTDHPRSWLDGYRAQVAVASWTHIIATIVVGCIGVAAAPTLLDTSQVSQRSVLALVIAVGVLLTGEGLLMAFLKRR